MSCFDIRENLSAWMDGELPAQRANLVERHLEGCDDCRVVVEELNLTRQSLSDRFEALRTEAPAAPRDLHESLHPVARRRARWRRPSAWLVTAAAVLVSIAALIYDPAEPAIAGGTPSEVIQRASANYARFRDAELRVRLELPGIEALRSAFGDENVESEPLGKTLAITMRSPDQVLIQDMSEARTITGYDGKDRWEYTPKSGEVVIGGDMEIDFGAKKGDEPTPDINWMDILSWRVVRDLNGNAADFDIREDTWPADRRAGRRVFHITPKVADSKFVWGSMRLVIDPQRDLVERAEMDVRLVGFPLVNIRADLVETDTGYPAGYFHWSHHVPEGTRVRPHDDK